MGGGGDGGGRSKPEPKEQLCPCRPLESEMLEKQLEIVNASDYLSNKCHRRKNVCFQTAFLSVPCHS
jgi:hypothetical protein